MLTVYVNWISSIVTIVMGGLAYNSFARKRMWWPHNSKLPKSLRETVKKELTDAKRVHLETRIFLTFLEEEGDNGLWIQIYFKQVTKNIGKHLESFNYRFSMNGRRTRNLNVICDNEKIHATSETESQVSVSSELKPSEKCCVEISYEILYHQTDSELFVAYSPSELYEFTLVDKISEAAGQKEYVIETDNMFSKHIARGIRETAYQNNPFSRHFMVKGGLLPLSGVYVNWRKKR